MSIGERSTMTLQGTEMSKIISGYKVGFSLPASFYNSPEVFDVDLDVFFQRHWIVAGVAADIPEAGDVRAVEVGSASVLIVRDDDMKIRAFLNVCRHRGARLVNEEQTSVGRLVCPYHQWSYDLTGELVHARHMGQDFDKSCHGLKPVNLRTISGLIFICVTEEAPEDIDEVAAILEERLGAYGLADSKIAHESTILEEGNWKLSVDNNRECYHCEGSHPELCRTLVGMDIGFDPAELNDEEREEYSSHRDRSEAQLADWERRGFTSAKVERYSGFETMLRTERFVITGPGESHTMDGHAACRVPLGTLSDSRLGDLHLHTHNSWHHFFADHAVVSYLVPVSPTKTRLRTVWLVNANAVEGVDYDLNRLTEVWLATNQQDADLVEITQRGVASIGYEPGPLSGFSETLVEQNNAWYIERLRHHGFVA